jgi:glyoxylase-like metal-dependent hydrolase (beta-lactamase superfamily II)
MCQLKGDPESEAGDELISASSTCFTCRRLNDTTFLIVEEDKWGESPFIYVKVHPTVLVVIDTGCGGAAKDRDAQLTSLREFIETYPVVDNGNQPLNAESQKGYIVICSHCHYDHIGERVLKTPKCKDDHIGR